MQIGKHLAKIHVYIGQLHVFVHACLSLLSIDIDGAVFVVEGEVAAFIDLRAYSAKRSHFLGDHIQLCDSRLVEFGEVFSYTCTGTLVGA